MKHKTQAVIIFLAFLFSANIALAGDVSQFVFTTDPQTIKPNEISETMTVRASASLLQTGCLKLETASATGEFSSSNTSWKPVDNLTMRTGSANRSFYYKDSEIGNYTITINIALRPEEEKRSCASWPVEEWDIKWTLMQNIVVLSASSASTSDVGVVPSQDQQQSTTVVDLQSEPEAKQEPAVVMENSDPAAQLRPQIKSAVEQDKKPAKNTQTEIQKPEPKSTTVVDSGPKAKETPVYVDAGNSVSDNKENTQQVASVISAGQNNSWSVKKWLMIVLGIGVVSSVGFFLIRRQSSV